MQDKKQIISSIAILVVAIFIIWLFAYFNNKNNASEVITDNTSGVTTTATGTLSVGAGTVSPLDTFAKCLADQNLVMYGAAWCSHCAAQKKLFGSSFQYVKYVECPDNIKLCTDKGVLGYPTWIDNLGVKHEGEQTLAELAKITSCVLPQ